MFFDNTGLKDKELKVVSEEIGSMSLRDFIELASKKFNMGKKVFKEKNNNYSFGCQEYLIYKSNINQRLEFLIRTDERGYTQFAAYHFDTNTWGFSDKALFHTFVNTVLGKELYSVAKKEEKKEDAKPTSKMSLF